MRGRVTKGHLYPHNAMLPPSYEDVMMMKKKRSMQNKKAQSRKLVEIPRIERQSISYSTTCKKLQDQNSKVISILKRQQLVIDRMKSRNQRISQDVKELKTKREQQKKVHYNTQPTHVADVH